MRDAADRGTDRMSARAVLLAACLLNVAPQLPWGEGNALRVDELEKLGRDALIQMAVERIQSNNGNGSFEREHFDQIVVAASGGSVIVDFAMSLRYVPLGSLYSHWARVDIVENSITTSRGRVVSTARLTRESGLNIAFYVPSESADAEALFAIRKLYPEIQSVRDVRLPPGAYIEILEKPLFYQVTKRSPSTYTAYRIGKLLGIVSGMHHESLVAEEVEGIRVIE